jgi:hypothetical protein
MVSGPRLRAPATPGGTGIRPFVDAPYAGHSVVIADYHPGQSLVETLRDNGADRAVLTGREPVTEDRHELLQPKAAVVSVVEKA